VLGGEGTGPSVRQNMPAIRAQLPSYQNLPPQRTPWPSTHNELTYPPPLDASGNPVDNRGPRLFVSLFAAVLAGAIAFGVVVAWRSHRGGPAHQPRPDEFPTAKTDVSGSRAPIAAPTSTLALSPALAAFLDAGAKVNLAPPPTTTATASAVPVYRPPQGHPGGPVAPPVTTRPNPPPLPTAAPANTGGREDPLW